MSEPHPEQPPAQQASPEQPPAAEPARSTASRFRPLDGLRGLAVLAVVLFHLGFDAFPGGLLGVDVFFVLSGFLITGLLLGEWRETGRLSLRRFWIRRWRRLLPALLLVLVVVAVLAQWLSDPAQVSGIRDESVATLFYVANWQAIVSGSSYFDVVAVSPLRHTWSLGVEEQFYVVWPLLAILALTMRRSSRLLLGLAVGGAALSAGLMVGLAQAGVGMDRLYFGTDTRAQALLVGSALAAVLHRRRIRLPGVSEQSAAPHPRTGPVAVGVGLLGLAVLVGFVLRVNGESAWLYRGGFALVGLATAAILASVTVAPQGLPARLLSVVPLVYLGRISYGLYLWHWPAVVYLTPDRVGLEGWQLALLRTAVMLTVSIACFHVVEQPIRRHGLRLPQRVPGTRRIRPAALARVVVPVGVIALAVALLAVPTPPATSALAALQQAAPDAPPAAPPDVATPTASAPSSSSSSSNPSAATPRRVLAPALTRKGPTRVMLVGDSVAHSLGEGLVPAVDPSTVTFTNQGYLGCGVTRGKPRGWDQPAACLIWPERWQSLVDQFRPDVTLLLPSVWDTFDRQRDGRWQRLGEPEFDAYVTSEFETAIRVLTSRGGRVAALAPPCDDADLANAVGPNRLPPQDAERYARLAALLGAVLQRHPGVTTTLPFDQLICPGGKFERKRDGHEFRSADGVHLEPYAGELFARTLLPDAVRWVRTPAYATG